tara:strand:+ start:560 stop:697 length:138 start_codon:yes stop_codon:yes gene_type:complete
VIGKVAKHIKLAELLINVGDLYVQSTKSETDDKVWNKAKEFIKNL